MIVLGKNKATMPLDFGRFKEILGDHPSFNDAFSGKDLTDDQARELGAFGYKVMKVK